MPLRSARHVDVSQRTIRVLITVEANAAGKGDY
jgi:hypothetical protein